MPYLYFFWVRTTLKYITPGLSHVIIGNKDSQKIISLNAFIFSKQRSLLYSRVVQIY
jgi:hypothetical protein